MVGSSGFFTSLHNGFTSIPICDVTSSIPGLAMMSDAALEEKKRHEEHRKQFDQVEELLKAQPDNPELLQLKKV